MYINYFAIVADLTGAEDSCKAICPSKNEVNLATRFRRPLPDDHGDSMACSGAFTEVSSSSFDIAPSAGTESTGSPSSATEKSDAERPASFMMVSAAVDEIGASR